MLGLLILYVFFLPICVSYSKILDKQNLNALFIFDVMFMISRFLDLFIGFSNKDGQPEKKISAVIYKNFSSAFYFEIIYSFGPLFFDVDHIDSLYYFLFKFPRYNMLFDMSHIINRTLEYYLRNWTVFEIKNKVEQFNILQFAIQTFNTLHILTCSQIVLCLHRDFDKSWMANQGLKKDETLKIYIVSFYFVTTTLSTCGFGDISATVGDRTECFVITILQFIGMLFYSYTIGKIQSFLVSDYHNPGEYVQLMTEEIEQLIVKVGMVMPKDSEKINCHVINSWKEYVT